MPIKFSETKQAFYETDFDYGDNLPGDLSDIPSSEVHLALVKKINEGHRVFADFTYSEKRPSQTHVWENGEWVDSLTPAQKYEQYLKSLRPLTRRQFKLILLKNGMLNNIDTAIASIEDAKQKALVEIEYIESTQFERLSPSVAYMCQLLNLTDEQVNQMWEQGLEL